MIVAIDFDGTIHDDVPVPPYKMGRPIAGAKEALQAMKDRGDSVVIFTARGGSPKHVEEWLDYFEIPFDKVTNIKQSDFDLIIDDKAEKFTRWDLIAKFPMRRNR